MTDVASFHITGPTEPWPGRDAFVHALGRGVDLFVESMKRWPSQDEFDLLTAAYLRHFEAEEVLEPRLRIQ